MFSVAGRINVTHNRFGPIANSAAAGVASRMRTGMLQFLMIADRKTPVDEGLLKGNKTIVAPTASLFGNPKGKITWNQHYGIYQEFGTVYMPGVHFASQAAAMIMPDYVASFKGVFEGGSVF